MNKFFKSLGLDKLIERQLELGKEERNRLEGKDLTPTPVPNQTVRSEAEIILQYKARRREKRRNILVGVIAVSLVLYIMGSNSDSNNSESSPYPVIEEDLAIWIPVGFNSWAEDPNVAWRWLKNNEYKCDNDRSCTGIMVVAKNGCDRNLYAEVSIIDKNEVQIGYTNDSVSSALSMEESKLIFNTYEEDADTVRVSKISCY
jgi:hypothetical protein